MPNTTLMHYGVKGMQWGVRRDRGDGLPVGVTTSQKPGKRVTAKGGENQPASADAIKAVTARQTARKSTTDALSTKELQDLVQRMNLEQQYARLTSKPETRFQKLAKAFVGDLAKDQAITYLDRDPRTEKIAEALMSKEQKQKKQKAKDAAAS